MTNTDNDLFEELYKEVQESVPIQENVAVITEQNSDLQFETEVEVEEKISSAVQVRQHPTLFYTIQGEEIFIGEKFRMKEAKLDAKLRQDQMVFIKDVDQSKNKVLILDVYSHMKKVWVNFSELYKG